jgi:hypothetical protein
MSEKTGLDNYAFEARLTAVVRVKAVDEATGRKVVPTVLGAPGTSELKQVNTNNAQRGLDATVTDVKFFPELASVSIVEVRGSEVQARGRGKRRGI